MDVGIDRSFPILMLEFHVVCLPLHIILALDLVVLGFPFINFFSSIVALLTIYLKHIGYVSPNGETEVNRDKV